MVDSLTKIEIYTEALENLKWKTQKDLVQSIINSVESHIKNHADPMPGITIVKRVIDKEVDRIYNIQLLLDELSTKEDL